jgi:hypothetical protein
MLGLEVFLGNGSARDAIVVQIGGEALMMPVAVFRLAVTRNAARRTYSNTTVGADESHGAQRQLQLGPRG